MEVKIDEINGTLTINGNTHEFLIGDDGDVVSEWVKSPNKNQENGKMLVAELLYIANVRQGNKQIERAKSIRKLAEFIKQNLKPKMMAGGSIPNTVAEFNSKMNSFSKRLGEAEKSWKLDNGKAYKDIIAERDEYYQKTKDAWYSTLSEEEESGNMARYNVIRKMIDDAFGFEDGGNIDSFGFNYEIGGL